MNQTYEIYALYDRLEIKFLQKINFGFNDLYVKRLRVKILSSFYQVSSHFQAIGLKLVPRTIGYTFLYILTEYLICLFHHMFFEIETINLI